MLRYAIFTVVPQVDNFEEKVIGVNKILFAMIEIHSKIHLRVT